MYRYLTLIALVFTLSGCMMTEDLNELLLQSSEISLTWKGEVQVSYSPEKFQLGYNSGRHEFRVYDDKLSEWFVVRCSETPTTEGQEITADVSWTGKNRVEEFNGISMKVEKSDDTGLIWLWGESKKIGIILQNR